MSGWAGMTASVFSEEEQPEATLASRGNFPDRPPLPGIEQRSDRYRQEHADDPMLPLPAYQRIEYVDYQRQATDLRERINDAVDDEVEFARIGELATFVNSLALGQVFASAPDEDAAQTTVGARLDQLTPRPEPAPEKAAPCDDHG